MNTSAGYEEERTLTALPLTKPIKFRVLKDSGGVSLFGQDTLRGFCGSGKNYGEALAVFVDGLLREYYEGWLSPKPSLAHAERLRALHVHALLWPKGLHDDDACKEET